MNSDLSRFTDDEIASEYHWRMMRVLGDPRVGVTVPVSDWKGPVPTNQWGPIRLSGPAELK
jgi:hypothetical protein